MVRTGRGRGLTRGSYLIRQAATVIGAIVVMAGAGLSWLRTPRAEARDVSPFHLSLKWLWETGAGSDADPVKSIGMLLLVLVGVMVLGLVTAGTTITIAGGIGAVAAATAFAVAILRSQFPFPDTLGLGVWLTVAGGLIASIGSVVGARAGRY